MKMRTKRIALKLTGMALVFSVLGFPASYAEDIDIYTGGEASTGAPSNVLIILDNTTNWVSTLDDGGRRGDVELRALKDVVSTLPDTVNLGLMTIAKGGSDDEGQVRYHIRSMDNTNRTRLQSVLEYLYTNALDGHNVDEVAASTNYDLLMDGALRYFNGLKRRYDGSYVNNSGEDRKDHKDNAAVPAYDPNPNPSGYAWAYDSANQTTYNKPADTDAGCAKNYVILIGNGWTSNPESASTRLTRAASDLSAAVGRTFTADTTSISGTTATYADEFARFMYQVGVPTNITDPQNSSKKLNNAIVTYTIDVCKGACNTGQEPNQTTLLKSMATVGGGKYFQAKNSTAIKTAISTIMAEIQAVNSVFASATLPISVNTQGTYENQVYIGVFRPDGSSRPRWYGNLKEYKFGRYCDVDGNEKVLIDSTRTTPLTGTYSSTDERVADDVTAPDCGTKSDGTKRPVSLYLADQNGYTAVDETNNTGFMDLRAKSYWTSDSTFWAHNPIDPSGSSDSPDGPNVERGGAAQRLRNTWTSTDPTSSRKIYTCLDSCLGAASGAAERTLSATSNLFVATNTDVTALLPVPSSTAKTVSSLTRSGNPALATATTSTAHGFSTGDAITIAGASQSEYNGIKTITKVDSTRFTYPLTETPRSDTASAIVGGATATYTISSLAIASPSNAAGVVSATATATLSGYPVPLATTDTPSISGANQSFLNGGSKTLTTVSGTTSFSYSVNVTPKKLDGTYVNTYALRQTYSSAPYPTATNNSLTFNIKEIYYLPGSAKALVRIAPQTSPKKDASNFNVGTVAAPASVVISGAFAPFNGTFSMSEKASVCGDTLNAASGVTASEQEWFCYSLPLSSLYTTPDGGATKQAAFSTGGETYDPVDIARNDGSTTVTVTVNSGPTSNTAAAVGNFTSFEIRGASNSAYNGTWTVAANPGAAPRTFTFSILASDISPVTPATGTITATSSSSTPKPTTADLINWTRGKDLWEDENLDGLYTGVRASIHGDVLHSRPVVVNYGSTLGIYGFYGSNDGFLRSVKAGLASTDGAEQWAFIPSEFMNYTKLSRLYNDSQNVRFPNSACSVTPTPTARDYFWDGVLTAYQSADGTASTAPSKTWLFATMRRGGRSIYAIDVTTPTTPKFMWRIVGGDSTNYPDFTELGQTWSEPKITKLKGTFKRASGSTTITDPVVLVFGAGYDNTTEDAPTGSAVTPSMGRGVYVVEAETGKLIKFLEPPVTTGVVKYSIPADVNVLDYNADGFADRIYAVDTNANVFRFDPGTVDSSTVQLQWKSYWIGKLGDNGHNGGSNARKFMYAPELLPFTYASNFNVMVLAGSGNREKPLPNFKTTSTPNSLTCSSLYSDTYYSTSSSNKVEDMFFGLIDTVQVGADETTINAHPILVGDLKEVNASTSSLTPFSLSTMYTSVWSSPTSGSGLKRGWYVALKNDPGSTKGIYNEEKTVNSARVVAGVVYFGTSTPAKPDASKGICSNLGEALGYAIDPLTGLPAINRDSSTSDGAPSYTQTDYATKYSGGGLPPTVTAGVVTIGGTPYRFIIGSGGATATSTSSIAGQRNIVTVKGTRSRLFWSYGADQ